MPRALTFVRLICFALVLGVLVLHIPLDAFREKSEGCSVASCCESGTSTQGDDCSDVGVDTDASAPLPQDGCDSGCHCGCCGGLPLAMDTGPSPGFDELGVPTSYLDRPGARCARRLEVFHPPRA